MGRREGGEDGVEEVADAGAVFGGDGEDVAEAEAAEVFGGGSEGDGVDLVDGEEDGLAAAQKESGEGDVGRGELGAAVDDHDDDGGFGEGGAGLEEDFGGDEFGVVGDDAAGVDQAGGGGLPLDEAVDAVAGDSGLVADDGAARTGEAIEERRLADVGAAADGDEWERAGGGRVGGERSSWAARISASRQARVSAGDSGAGGGCRLYVVRLEVGRRCAGGGSLLRDNYVGFALGGAGGGALLFILLGALGGEGLALAGIDRSGGGCGARGAALLGAGGCLTMLLAEAFSVVALRHGECLPGDAMRLRTL